MDDQQFDQLSKSLATSVSRRQAMKVLGATAIGGVAALFGARGASAHHNARCKDIGDNCRSNAECCERVCVDFHCVCPGGTVLCPGTNECLPACPGGRIFNPDTCECECPPGTSPCGEFTCCTTNTSCCNAQGFGFCCPQGTTCCEVSFQCCPPGTQCTQQGCVSLQCTTPGRLCFSSNECGQNCQCVNANPPFFPGTCQ
jgi:hypothetical protein